MSRYLHIFALVVAGEMVFGLPFQTARFFRPTMLDVFNFSNTQLGDLFAVYGVTAMLSYFPGGALADRFSARSLLSASLLSTAVGGLYMATIPGPWGMAALYGFWGVTTIFLFWGALIRATREWGGEVSQGAAFGLLEGGRGIAAAVAASTLVTVLAWYLPGDAATATDEARRSGLQAVIYGYSAIAVLAAALVWYVVPDSGDAVVPRPNTFASMLQVLGRPVLWAQAAIIVCAYCGYKSIDYYSLYAVQVLGTDEVEGARLASYGAYVRPVAALSAGLIADRIGVSKTLGLLFAIMGIAFAALAVSTPASIGLTFIFLNLGVTLFAVFALRGIYFALLQELRTPRRITGAAVGMISLVGFTPEIFFAPIAGRILDAAPGVVGFQNLFILLVGISALGVVTVSWLLMLKRNNRSDQPV